MKRIGYFRTFAICLALALGACSAAQLSAVQSDISTGINAACADVASAAKVNPTSPVVVYAEAACPLGIASASLVQNSATIQWLGQVQTQLAAPAPAPAPAASTKS